MNINKENYFVPKNCNSFVEIPLDLNIKNLLLEYIEPANYYVLFENVIKEDIKNEAAKDNKDKNTKKRDDAMDKSVKLLYGVSAVNSILKKESRIMLNAGHIYCVLEFLSIFAEDTLNDINNTRSLIENNQHKYDFEKEKFIDKINLNLKILDDLKLIDRTIRYSIDFGSLKIIENLYTEFTLKKANGFVSKRFIE